MNTFLIILLNDLVNILDGSVLVVKDFRELIASSALARLTSRYFLKDLKIFLDKRN